MMNVGEKTFWIAVGAVSGGTLAYMISEVIVDKVMYDRSFHEVEEDLEEETVKVLEEDMVIPPGKTDYTSHVVITPKTELSELAKPYQSQRVEHPIRVTEYDGEETVLVSYYVDDTTYCFTESKFLIDDAVSAFGPNAHLHFGEYNDDPDTVYIQNDNEGVMFEVHRIFGSYKTMVLNEPSDEPEKPKKQPAKRVRRASKKANAKPDPKEELTDEPTEDK